LVLVGQMLKLPDDYITLDFETNGLPKGGDTSLVDIIEIAYTVSTNRQIVKQLSQLAKPAQPLPAKIIEITHITDAMLVGMPTPLEVAKLTFPDVVNSDLPIVGHNIIGFDRLFLDKYCDLLGLKRIDTSRYLDTAAMFKSYRKGHRAKSSQYNLPNDQKSFFRWGEVMLEKSWSEDSVKYNLDAAIGYLAIPQFGISTERHRALYDVILTTRVFEALRIELGL